MITTTDAIEAQVARQNQQAAQAVLPETVVDYDPDVGAFVVKCGGEAIDWFATRRAAEMFAKRHDYLLPKGGRHD